MAILLKVNLANLAILLNKVVILLKDNPDNLVTLRNRAATRHNKAAIPLKDNPVILNKVAIPLNKVSSRKLITSWSEIYCADILNLLENFFVALDNMIIL